MALADFVAPIGGPPDWIGGFAVTAGHGELEIAAQFKAAGDDYSAILAAALADRLAEAFAEALHRRCAPSSGASSRTSRSTSTFMIAEKYRGIRPAPGYPAQPDHTEKATLFQLLDADAATGIELTESFAMTPPASVSGLYFAQPEAHYFGVGKIERDQVEDYARRKGWDLADRRALAGPDPQLRAGAGRSGLGGRGSRLEVEPPPPLPHERDGFGLGVGHFKRLQQVARAVGAPTEAFPVL